MMTSFKTAGWRRGLHPLATGIGLLLLSAGAADAASQYIIYPSKGQTIETQASDESDCRSWAGQQSGFDPAQAPPSVQTVPTGGEVIGGAAKGAALGTVGGLIGGDAGKGAAIGAGVGATAGLMRKGRKQRANTQAQQQATAQYDAKRDLYDRAFATCMQGRGYAVN